MFFSGGGGFDTPGSFCSCPRAPGLCSAFFVTVVYLMNGRLGDFRQVSLFESIKPLFANKQLLVIANKTDVAPFKDLK